jgi:signal peptidase I
MLTKSDFRERGGASRWAIIGVLVVGVMVAGVIGYSILNGASPTEREGGNAKKYTNYQTVALEGNAMEPTLLKGQTYNFAPKERYERGEIVWLNDPAEGPKVRHVRRIVAIGGDTVELRNGALYLNGQLVQESYVKPGEAATLAPVTLGAGQIFVLSDNRASATDSRKWGAVPATLIRGAYVAETTRK